ncbi:metalloregulatory [Fusarium albosuccineum]|uniref:Metalloregulatory n=1 Tax=Fusarium albosuccineum TaxID=1237068 RepID=A0A8H4L5F0_9HYPO|nr:metalloregulatory [Fusarium albosuccineum]
MDHSVAFAHQASSFESSVDKVDYGFESLLGQDASLTHGLDSLGTCNNTENACLDQRCFDHYGKTSAAAAKSAALDIGVDINSNPNRASPRLNGKSQPRNARIKSRSLSATSAANMFADPSSKPQKQRHKRKRQSHHMSQSQDLHQTHHIHQMHSPQSLHHVQQMQHIEPTAALQSLNETLQHPFHMDTFHPSFGDFQQHHSHTFAMTPSPHDRWPQSVAPSWANMMVQPTAANCMPMAWPTHMSYEDAASAACSSACDDPKCWSQCGDATDADCCFDSSCAELDFSHAACCFEPTCASLEPCLDASCQEASIPCTDANCIGTTVSTTPASMSVTTPSAEPEPLVNTIVSPVEPGREVSSDLDHAIGHDLGDFAHHLHHDFTSDLNSSLHQHLGHHLTHDHSGQEADQDPVFAMPSHPPTPKPKVADTQSTSGDTEFSCRWICDNGLLCSRKFESNKELQDHCKNEHVKNLKKDTNGFCCEWYACIRPGPFSQKSKLERHMQTHTGYKPVKCDICGIMLSAKQSLEQHMRTHSGEKPWKCTYEGCTQRFKQQSALTMHMRTHTGEKPLQCELCGKRFGESSNLSKHRRTHNIKGNHVCDFCGKDFHRLDQLRRHLQTHLLEGGRKGSKSS